MTDTPKKRSPVVLPWLVAALLLVVAIANRHLILDSDPRIAPNDLQAIMDSDDAPLLVDVRSAREYAAGHIPGAVHVGRRQIPEFAADLPDRDQAVVLYCETGARSRAARNDLRDLGFTNLIQLEGDMTTWRRLGLPVTAPPNPVRAPGRP